MIITKTPFRMSFLVVVQILKDLIKNMGERLYFYVNIFRA